MKVRGRNIHTFRSTDKGIQVREHTHILYRLCPAGKRCDNSVWTLNPGDRQTRRSKDRTSSHL